MAETEQEEFEVQVKEVPSLTAAAVEYTGPYEDIGKVLVDLFKWVLIHRGRVATYPMAVFPSAADRKPGENNVFEVCIPLEVDSGVTGDKEVKIKGFDTLTVAAARHEGPHSKIGETYGKLLSWIEESGYGTVGPCREVYLTNPTQFAEDDLLTEVQVVVIDKRH